MCGIITIINNNVLSRNFLQKKIELYTLKDPIIQNFMPKIDIGYKDTPPVIVNDIAILCEDGDIYNYKELYSLMGITPTTEYNSEIIIHLYRNYGIEYTLQIIDGTFSFVLIDYRITEKCARMYVARDPFGVKPIYMLKPAKIPANKERSQSQQPQPHENIFAFAKDLKTLNSFEMNLAENQGVEYVINQLQPGSYSMFEFPTYVLASWKLVYEEKRYFTIGPNAFTVPDNIQKIKSEIRERLIHSVGKMCNHKKFSGKFACMLSGGFSSSLMAAIVNNYCKMNDLPKIETYCIGLEGSADLKYAKMVADHLDTNHTEIVLNEKTLINEILADAIPHVVYSVESYDIKTVREGIYRWLLGKHIKNNNSEVKYIFCGDGLTELTGTYLENVENIMDFDSKCFNSMKNMYRNTLVYTENSISSYGLQSVLPYLDNGFVSYYMMIPSIIRNNFQMNYDRYLIRTAFEDFLPNQVLFRDKERFSDSLQSVIETYANTVVADGFDKTEFSANTKEEHLYRSYFMDYFGENLILLKN